MDFKKSEDIGQNLKIYGEEMEHEEIPVEVEHSYAELHNPYEV